MRKIVYLLLHLVYIKDESNAVMTVDGERVEATSVITIDSGATFRLIFVFSLPHQSIGVAVSPARHLFSLDDREQSDRTRLNSNACHFFSNKSRE